MPIHGVKRVRESFSAKKRSSSADESGNAEWLILIRHRKSLAPGRSGVDEHRGAGRLDNDTSHRGNVTAEASSNGQITHSVSALLLRTCTMKYGQLCLSNWPNHSRFPKGRTIKKQARCLDCVTGDDHTPYFLKSFAAFGVVVANTVNPNHRISPL
jgi:hypothetical protein